jgi:hypothetical protein
MGRTILRKAGGVLLLIGGWLAGGIGFAEPIPNPWNTLLFVSMFPIMGLGLYFLSRK